jgi:DNA-binding NarL/FixJ family response regulator
MVIHPSAPTGNAIRILLVEDHPIVGEEIYGLLGTYPNIDLIGRAQDGEEAVSKVDALQPAVVVMDINLPKMDGIAATRLIKRKHPHIVVIGLTAAREEYLVYAMLKAGAYEVLAKETAEADLYSTIQKGVAAANTILILKEDQNNEDTTSSSDKSSELSAGRRMVNTDPKTHDDPQ